MTIPKIIIKISLATSLIMSVGTVEAQDDGISIFDNIKVKGEIRPRYENVNEANAKPNANALTNRLVLGVNADLFGTDWLSTYVEMTDVHAVNNNYDGLDAKGNPNSVVADPEQTRLTQSYVDIKYNNTRLRAGRQMVNLDNQRFVGAVGWRQMPQTFNAVNLVDNSIDNLNLMAAYVTQINTVFDDGGVNADSTATQTVLLNAKYKVMEALSITGYGYLVEDFGDTYGLALTGKPRLSDRVSVNYRAEYAILGDASFETSGINTNNDADYMNLELGVNVSGVLAGINYEVQSGTTVGTATNETFKTPLGTNHKFNGWADKFLGTPTQGLVDINLMIGYKNKELGLVKALYHDFSSEVGGIDYGTEFDLLYTRAIPGMSGLTGTIKYANYSGSDQASNALIGGNSNLDIDTQKLWVMLDYKFSN